MSTSVRSGTGVLALLEESTAWATKEAAFEADKVRIPTSSLSEELQNAAIENDSAKVSDLGKHPNGVGVAFEASKISAETYAYGLGAEAGDGVTPTPASHCFAQLLGAGMGGVPTARTGDTIKTATSPTTTSVQMTTGSLRATPGFLAWKSSAGLTYVRPIGTFSTDTCTMLMAFPSAPAAEDVLPGMVEVIGSDDAMAHVLQGELLKRDTLTAADAAQMYEFFGAVNALTYPETSVAASPKVQHELRVAKFTRDNAKARTAPAARRPVVAAGGEFLIAKRGNTATTKLTHLNVGVTFGRAYTADPAANEDVGIGAWVLTAQDLMVTVTIKDNQALPAGFTATKWHQVFQEGTENLFHLMIAYGAKKAGQIHALYFPCLQLEREPEPVDIDGLQAYKLTFSSVSGLNDENKVWACMA